MKKRVFNIFTLLVCAVMLVCFTGCSDNAGDKGNGNDGKTGYVEFSCSDSSRTVLALNTPEYPVESLYWTYTAEKLDDGADVGSTTVQKVIDGSYEDCPGISATGVTGENNRIGPLSCGEWKFTIYGYLYPTDVDVNTGVARKTDSDNELIYKGVKSGTVTNSAHPATHYDSFNVNVDYKQDMAFLSLGTFTLKVPEGQSFIASSTSRATLIVRLLDVTNSALPKLIAISKKTLTSTFPAGGVVTLGNFEFVTDDDGTVSRNIYEKDSTAKFRFIAEYSGRGFEPERYNTSGITVDALNDPAQRDVVTPLKDFAPVGDFSGYRFTFTHPGVNSKFQGDLDYLIPASGDTENMQIKVAVAKIVDGSETRYYDTLSAASAAAISGQTITLLMNIENDSVSDDVTVDVNGKVLANVSIASGKTLTLLAGNNTSGSYAFTGGTVDFEYSGTNVTYNTSGNSAVTVDAGSDTITHTGTATSVSITNAGLYKLDTTGAVVTTVTATAGRLEIGNGVKITTLTVESGVTELTAHEFTEVTTIKRGAGGSVVLKDGDSPEVKDAAVSDVSMFKCISLTYGGTTKYIYGIKGMKIKLPTVADAFGTGSKNMYWYTEADKTNVKGAKIDNNSEFVCGDTIYTTYVDTSDNNKVKVEPVVVQELYAQVYPTPTPTT